jgi:hypothetical protein
MEEMTEERALELVDEGLVGENSIPVKLRGGGGLDEEMLERTKAALLFLKDLYRDRDTVPKRLAFATVDLSGTLMSRSREYSDELWYRVEVAGEQLVDLAYSIFEGPGEPEQPGGGS